MIMEVFRPSCTSDPKEIRAAAKDACLLYPDMNRLLHQLIVKYQHTPHRELQGMTPHQKWSEGLQSSGLPLVPPFTQALDRLFLRMYSQTRQVRSQGIPAFSLNYWSAELGGIERISPDGKPVQYTFRYDPTDISRISVFRNGEWVGDGYARELQQADGSYRHLGLTEWKMTKQRGATPLDSTQEKTPEELALVAELSQLQKRRTREKKTAQQNTALPSQPSAEQSKEAKQAEPELPLDEETKRVLRFLHG
jgi:hypothetical protein